MTNVPPAMGHYRRIRKHHEPVDPQRILSAERLCGFAIGGGYADVLRLHGVGVIAGDISVVAPEEIIPLTERYRGGLAENISMPAGLDESIIRKAVLVATTATRLNYWYHPAAGSALLLYDGDADRCLRCPFGFSDPRVAFDRAEIGDIDFPALVFDSLLNCGESQFTCQEAVARIHELAEPAFRMWFTPGDLVVGATGNCDIMTAYLSGLGGYITFQGHNELNRPNLVSLSYDRSVENEVAVYARSLVQRGFEKSTFR